MERTDQDFKDGLALDLFSPKNRTLVVKQNTSPLPAQFITGTTGEPFVALSNYSYIIQMNETANDLIAKIEVPYDPEQLVKIGVQEANTYVATLAPDKMSWVIDDSTRNVHRSENNTRTIKITSMDGEYLLVGRQTVDTSNIFVQYGQGGPRTVNMTAGSGLYFISSSPVQLLSNRSGDYETSRIHRRLALLSTDQPVNDHERRPQARHQPWNSPSKHCLSKFLHVDNQYQRSFHQNKCRNAGSMYFHTHPFSLNRAYASQLTAQCWLRFVRLVLHLRLCSQ
jgi:hypothetical protein